MTKPTKLLAKLVEPMAITPRELVVYEPMEGISIVA